MKLTKFTHLLVLGLVLTVAASGCRKKPVGVTNLPKAGMPPVAAARPNDEPFGRGIRPVDDNARGRDVTGQDVNPATNLNPPPVKPSGPSVLPNPADWSNAQEDKEIFKAYTVLFDFDSSAIRSSEKSKVQSVADHLKSNPAQGLRVEGNCDERGTEEYNRALGERRALAVREELIRLGVNPDHVLTISFGKDKPAVEGHDEAAWSKNRRDDFVLLTRPAAP